MSRTEDTPLWSVEDDPPLAVAGLLVATTALLSGPVGFALTLLRPQPPWTDAATFAAHAHPLQQAPYWLGFGLLASSIMLVARLGSLAWERHRTRAMMALVLVAIYGALITINYALQVAYVPLLARTASPVLGYVTMANPEAPTWLLEMFGYGVLGVATWLLAPLFGEFGRRRWIRRLLVANGAISVAGALACAGGLSWLQTVPGLVAYLGWNAVFIAAALVIAVEYRPRRTRSGGMRGARSSSHEGFRRRR
jgi:hypothetical protein